MWIARDKDNTLKIFFSEIKPVKSDCNISLEGKWWAPMEGFGRNIDEDLFPDVTWENSPKKIYLCTKQSLKAAIDKSIEKNNNDTPPVYNKNKIIRTICKDM